MTKQQEQQIIRAPTKFVNLHGHSVVGSPGDAIDFPDKHVEFALKNGSDAIALTDHGSMAGISFFKLAVDKINSKSDKPRFKGIPGVEAYFIDSLPKWRQLLAEDKEAKEEAARAREAAKQEQAVIDSEEWSDDATKAAAESLNISRPTLTGDQGDDDEKTVIESEEESKSNKWLNPLMQRNHIVLLPKNSTGLKTIFRIVSESYRDGFYRYPRLDMDMLRKYSNRNIVALSACVAGRLAKTVYDNMPDPTNKDSWTPDTFLTSNHDKVQDELAKIIAEFQDALGPENYYLELQFNSLPHQSMVNKHLIEASKRTGAKLVATCDSHYACPEHWREREIYKAMAWSSKTKGEVDMSKIPATLDQQHYQLYPKNAEQMWDSFETYCRKHYPDLYTNSDIESIRDAIELTHEIAHDQIGEIKFDTTIKYPSVNKLVDAPRIVAIEEKFGKDLSEDDIVMKELTHRVIQGLKYRKKANDQAYIDQCKEELAVIKHLKLQKYFLTYAKILEVVSKQMITGPGRGSAGASLVLYVLNITQVDPLKYKLLFSRFITRFKKGAADIDLDYSDREKALDLISDHFGHEAVLPVTNFNQLKLKSLIKDLSRMYSLPYEEINKKTYIIEKEARAEARKDENFDAGVWELTYDEAAKSSPTFRELIAQYPQLDSSLKVLYRQVRGLSTHASGVGIYTGNPEELPIIKFGKLFQTPWPEGQNYRHLEAFGVLKYDVLGLGTLRMQEKCIEKILQHKYNRQKIHFWEIKDWYYKNVHPDNNMLDDQEVYKKIFWESKEVGVFQWVADNVKAFTAALKPNKIEDLSAITATFRPGPMKAGVDKLLLNNRRNVNDAIESLPHPSLAPILADTDYVLIYQEQVQKIFHALAGVPLDQTDDVRKAFTKRDLSNLEKSRKERERLKEEFVKNCGEHSKILPEDAAKIFEYMEKYVAYSFNLSHSISYAIVAYQCAWLQHYFPNEWITTYIDYCATDKGRVTGKEDPKAVAIKEAKMLGYFLGKPDINHSEETFVVNTILEGTRFKNTLVPSFSSLKFVGKSVLQEIRKYRPYKAVQDLILHPGSTNNWRHTKFSKRALATLIQLEALDSMGIVGPEKQFKNYRQLYMVIIDHYDKLKAIGKRKKNNDVLAAMEELIKTVQEERDWSLAEKLEFSKELAGSVDMTLILPQDKKDFLQRNGFNDIDSLFPVQSDDQELQDMPDDQEEVTDRCYGIVTSTAIAQTKKGKSYLKIKLLGDQGKERMCFVWNWKADKTVRIKENDVLIGLFKKTEFGLSAFESKIRIVVDKDKEPLPIAND